MHTEQTSGTKAIVRAIAALALACAAMLAAAPQDAAALTLTNSTPIGIPASGPANPYPSSVALSRFGGTVEDVNVTLHNFNHNRPSQVGIVLVAPSGQAMLLMDGAGVFSTSDATVTFDDQAPSDLPSLSWGSGTYRPANYAGGVHDFPAPGPGTAYANPGPSNGGSATMNGTFGGIDPNGSWQLYAVDFQSGDPGQIAAGWSLELTLDDPVPPETTIESGPSGTIATDSAEFAFASNEAGTFECSLDSGAFAPCESPKRYGNLDDGQHTFRVRAVDAAGNVDATPATRSFTVDTTPPTVTIDSGPSGTIGVTSAEFAFSASEAATFECSLDGAAFTPCESPVAYDGLSQGPHTFRVRATDAAGNRSAAVQRSFVVDLPPQTHIDTGPSGTIAVDSAQFTFSSNEAGTFECSLDGGAFTPCESPLTLTGLSEGPHALRVRAVDSGGQRDATPAERSFTVDTPPNTTITSGPSGPINSGSAQFTFSSNQAGTFECRLDGGQFAACTSPRSYEGLAEGSHTFEVRAVDAAGNRDPSPATRAFAVDTVPQTTITSGPADGATVRDATPSFGFESNQAGTTFECRIDGGEYDPCFSPTQVGPLLDGPHVFQVRATDPTGNVDPTPASRVFTIDTSLQVDGTPPKVEITNLRLKAQAARATLKFRGTDDVTAPGGIEFKCKIDNRFPKPCESPHTYRGLDFGPHRFQVRAIDAAGNFSAPATRRFRLRRG